MQTGSGVRLSRRASFFSGAYEKSGLSLVLSLAKQRKNGNDGGTAMVISEYSCMHMCARKPELCSDARITYPGKTEITIS